ncbi:MAG: 3-beta hydroxysteroid dehydrogenase/isomerase family protein [Rhodoglobus sp.]|nr:3-beta hydroxysteroid dehydrogenase/isomerase family protein [Rhodoglobus sp.]
MSRLLITGAAGRFGAVMRSGLARADRELVLTDIVPIEGAPQGSLVTTGDLSDLGVALEIVRDVDVVVHTAGIPDEAPFDQLLRSNIEATFNVFEAARLNGVRRVIFTSSAHVVGLYARDEPVDEFAPVRPDSLYGATKAFGEAIGRLYADKHGLEVACIRIGSFRPEPEDRRQLSTWLSPRDAVQLVDRCIGAERLSFSIVYGISANAERWWSDSTANELGYHPVDDGQAFAARIRQQGPEPGALWQGGIFAEPDYRGGAG